MPVTTLGILGGGQLARMICLDARRMGVRTVVWTGVDRSPPVDGVADLVLNEPFEDAKVLQRFCNEVDAVTVEFENIPASTLATVEGLRPLRPAAGIIQMTQNRAKEKMTLRSHGIETAPFVCVATLAELKSAYEELGPNCVLKTSESGYDGKGQVRLRKGSDLSEAWQQVDEQACVLEGFVDFACEASVLVARSPSGNVQSFPPARNTHREHILDTSQVPAELDEKTEKELIETAESLVKALNYEGLLAVEFFILKDGRTVVNELAPRPHNSGHFSMDSNTVSQFEQQIRAVLDLPLSSTRQLTPCVMLNLLGDMWKDGELDTLEILQTAGSKLHLYGKEHPGGMRKLGHVNLLADSTEEATQTATMLKEKLLGSSSS